MICFHHHDSKKFAFSIFRTKPSEKVVEDYVERLKALITDSHKIKTLQNLMNEIPTKVLVDEFSKTYVNELLKRNVDVKSLLTFLKSSLDHKTMF